MWAVAECVVFQTNLYDNNKLLYIWHFLGCVLAAGLLWDAFAALRPAGVTTRTPWLCKRAPIAAPMAPGETIATTGSLIIALRAPAPAAYR